MDKQNANTKIVMSASKRKTKNGKVIVSHVARDVYGNDLSTSRRKVRTVLDGLKIKRIAKPKKEALPDEISPPEDELKVELFLAIKAKSGSQKAFQLLQQLV